MKFQTHLLLNLWRDQTVLSHLAQSKLGGHAALAGKFWSHSVFISPQSLTPATYFRGAKFSISEQRFATPLRVINTFGQSADMPASIRGIQPPPINFETPRYLCRERTQPNTNNSHRQPPAATGSNTFDNVRSRRNIGFDIDAETQPYVA